MLFVVLTSQPLEATPSQLPKPELQLATWQVLAEQVAVALGRLHAAPQAPQLLTLLVRLRQLPLQFV